MHIRHPGQHMAVYMIQTGMMMMIMVVIGDGCLGCGDDRDDDYIWWWHCRW